MFALVSYWTIRSVGKNKDLSLSMHVAKTKRTILVFGLISLAATTLSTLTIFSDLLPSVNANALTYVVFSVLFAQFFITGMFPYIEGSRSGTIHNFAAWGMSFVIPIATAMLLFSSIDRATRLLTIAVLLVEITLLTIALVFNTVPKNNNFLYYQLAYIATFFIYLLIIIWG